MKFADQLDVFAAPVPSTRSATSRTAAVQVKDTAATRRRRQVLMVLRASSHGLARFEIAAQLGVPEHWITSSVDALKKRGEIEETTDTITNPTTGKHPAILRARPWTAE